MRRLLTEFSRTRNKAKPMKRISKITSLFLAVIMLVSALPITAFAESAPVIKLIGKDSTQAEIKWDAERYDYDRIIVEKSSDSSTWTSYTEITCYGDTYFTINLPKKQALYYRIKLADDNNNSVTEPSNALLIYPDLSEILYSYYCYTSASPSKAVLYWEISKFNYGSIDGFKIYASVNGDSYKYLKTVSVSSYAEKDTYSYSYKMSQTAPSKYGYLIQYKIYPYFTYNSKTYQYNGVGAVNASYVNSNFVTLTVKKDKVVVNIEKLKNAKYRIDYKYYNIKKKKTSKTYTKKTSKTKYTFKNKAKNRAMYISVTPYWGTHSSDSTDFHFTHSGKPLLNGAAKSKKTKIPVINVQGKKSKTAWTVTLTEKDKKIIKDFFYKKYKGKNPSRAEMAEYAYNWIHNNVTYDYKYKTGNLRYTDAIFNKHKGQCLQYNGAMAMVMTYLGYEVRIIQGKRGTSKNSWQHFWCEVKINGRWYLLECGNKKDGDWMHFVELYYDGQGYLKNKKTAKD